MSKRLPIHEAPQRPPATSNQPPSRHGNPFATCWTKPGAIPYRFTDGDSAEQLIRRMAGQQWYGAIIGPHGSGKSTLLEALKPALAQSGCQVTFIALRDGQRRLPAAIWHDLKQPEKQPPTRQHEPAGPPSNSTARQRVLIVDGYEQLSYFQRWRLGRYYRSRGVGLLVTSHVPNRFPCRVPTLFQTAPDRALVSQLVAELTSEVSTSITQEDVDASHACRGSNVREIFFDLYDRHEKLRH